MFQIEVQEPYPQLSGGQKVGALEVLLDSTVTCMYVRSVMSATSVYLKL